jgi:hypothetical protein
MESHLFCIPVHISFQGDARQHFAWSGSSGTLALAHSVVEETKARTEPFIESFLKVIRVNVTNTGTTTGTERCTWSRWWLSWQIAYLYVDTVLAHPTSQFGQRATRTPHHCEPPQLQRVITSPPWIRFKRRLNIWNRMKLEIISRTAKSQNSLVLTEQRCRGGTRVHSTPAPRRRASDSYSTHNRSMNSCCT